MSAWNLSTIFALAELLASQVDTSNHSQILIARGLLTRQITEELSPLHSPDSHYTFTKQSGPNTCFKSALRLGEAVTRKSSSSFITSPPRPSSSLR